MKNIFAIMFIFILMVAAPALVSAQPVPPPGTHYEQYCYSVLFPFPHSRCEYRLVHNYRVVPPPPPPRHRHYTPAPPPPGPRPGGHHPGPGPNHNHHGPGPKR